MNAVTGSGFLATAGVGPSDWGGFLATRGGFLVTGGDCCGGFLVTTGWNFRDWGGSFW